MRQRSEAGGDGGFSLIELVVVMSILSVVGAVFTTGVVQIYHASVATEAEATTQTQISAALLRLERDLRYAYSIGVVHNEGATAAPYVEYLVVAPEPGQTTYVKRCVQLRLSGADPRDLQLQTRSWTTSTVVASAWTPLASNLTTVAGPAPFTRLDPTPSVNHQLLTLRLVARSGSATKTSAVTFTALNTYASTALDTTGKPIAATAEPCYDPRVRS